MGQRKATRLGILRFYKEKKSRFHLLRLYKTSNVERILSIYLFMLVMINNQHCHLISDPYHNADRILPGVESCYVYRKNILRKVLIKFRYQEIISVLSNFKGHL